MLQDGEEVFFGQRFTHYVATVLDIAHLPLVVWAWCIVYAHQNLIDEKQREQCDTGVYMITLIYACIVTAIIGLNGLYALFYLVTGKKMKTGEDD